MKKMIYILFAAGILFSSITNIQAFELGQVDIHGFVSQGFLISDENNYLAETEDGTFQFNEIGINFTTTLTDNLRLGLQLFSYDFGETGNNEINVDWAYADYRWKNWLGLRAGIIKVPAGFYNESRDIDAVRTNIFLPQSVYYDGYRENRISLQGIGVYGDILHDTVGNFSYQIEYGTMNIDNDSGPARMVESKKISGQSLFEVESFDTDDILAAALKWETPLEGLLVGTSFYQADVAINVTSKIPLGEQLPAGLPLRMETSEYREIILSGEYTWSNLILSAEYITAHTETETLFNSTPVFPKEETDSQGWYISAAYRFTDWLEIGSYYSEYYPNKDDKDGENQAQGEDHKAWSKDIALTARFILGEYCNFKIEGHRIDGTAQLVDGDNPEGMEDEWFLFASKLTFNF
ncbi:porin [Desulfobacterales bacterium HSG17]|nr:porin [Desulfobacterales bacterium HSG17]